MFACYALFDVSRRGATPCYAAAMSFTIISYAATLIRYIIDIHATLLPR